MGASEGSEVLAEEHWLLGQPDPPSRIYLVSFLPDGTGLAHMMLKPKFNRIDALFPVTSGTSVPCQLSATQNGALTPTMLG